MAVSYNWIYAKDLTAVPEWIVKGHSWHNPVPIEKLQKLQMKVKMCCLKCEEKVQEEIREVEGVVNVRTEREDRKVVVVVVPTLGGELERKVLKKARKVDKEAQFVELDAHEKARDKPSDKRQGEEEEKVTKKEGKETKKEGKETIKEGHGKPIWGGPPLPGNVYGAGNWAPKIVREQPQPQHPNTLPSNSTKSTRQKRKPRSIFKKVIIWLFG